MKKSSPHRRGHGALILSVLIAIAIILILMFGNFGGGSYMKQVSNTRKKGKDTAAEISTQQLTILIAQYRQTNGKLPANWEELEAPAESYRDPWGQPLTFTCETDKRTGSTKVTFRSIGPDGEANTADDVVRTENLPF